MNLKEYLKEKGVWFRLLDKPSTIHTADASKVTGIPLERITKSLVFTADGRPVLAVIPGNKKVDMDKLAEAVEAEEVMLVPFGDTEKLSGYPPGGTPPVCHANIEKVVFDTSLTIFPSIYGGGGSRDKLIEIKVDDAIKLSHGIISNIIKE